MRKKAAPPSFLTKVTSFRFGFAAAIIFFLLISGVYAVMSLVKHSHYETFGDLGIFNQGIWQYSRFQFPMSTFHLNRPFLGDHFHPLLVVLAPFYWIYSSEKTLLFLQSFIILSAIIPLYLIGYRLTKSVFFSLCVVLAYAFYLPLQHGIFFDFHEIALVPPLFALAYYFFLQGRKRLVWLFLFLLLLVKEELGFFVAAFGGYLIFFKSWRRFGLFWLFFGALYSLVVVSYVIPAIGGGYIYLDYGSVGKTPLEVGLNFLKDPLRFFSLFFDLPVKRETLHNTFWPFAYLPLFSPLGLWLSFEQFFTRFVDQINDTRWTTAYHYSLIEAIVVPIGTIWTVGFYTKFLPKYRHLLIIAAGILLIFLTRIEQVNRSMVLLVKRPQFWARSAWMDDVDKAVSLVPKDAPVATQRSLISHVSTRKEVYPLFNLSRGAEYVLADFHPGQSTYNYYAIDTWQELKQEIDQATRSGTYQPLYSRGGVYLLKKGSPSSTLVQ